MRRLSQHKYPKTPSWEQEERDFDQLLDTELGPDPNKEEPGTLEDPIQRVVFEHADLVLLRHITEDPNDAAALALESVNPGGKAELHESEIWALLDQVEAFAEYANQQAYEENDVMKADLIAEYGDDAWKLAERLVDIIGRG